MSTTRLVVGTRDELAGVPLGTANVWERPGYPGLSVKFILPDHEFIAAVGTQFSLAGTSYRLTAIEPHPPTNGHVLVIEEVVSKAEPTPIPPYSGSRLAALCRQLTPDILAALHPAAFAPTILRWERESHDTYVTEWTGAKLGPSTANRRTAVFDDVSEERLLLKMEATVTVETIRWSEYDVAFVEVRATWHVGDTVASCWARGTGLDPITGIFLHGPAEVIAMLEEALLRADS